MEHLNQKEGKPGEGESGPEILDLTEPVPEAKMSMYVARPDSLMPCRMVRDCSPSPSCADPVAPFPAWSNQAAKRGHTRGKIWDLSDADIYPSRIVISGCLSDPEHMAMLGT